MLQKLMLMKIENCFYTTEYSENNDQEDLLRAQQTLQSGNVQPRWFGPQIL